MDDAPPFGALPCPYPNCGCRRVWKWEPGGPGTYAVACYQCGCTGPVSDHTWMDAVRLWNLAKR